MKKPYQDHIFHVISNTHWDREWRFPYQRNRQKLVEMIDSVVHILENNPDYRAFHLDSQSVVITDYLEIRPEKEDQIRKLVESGRLLIGPWFILPDEFMVSGENLLRNLLLGHKICRQFGKVSKVGYSPFSWGQISQLPQIYNGFGVDLIMFYRGMNSLDSKSAEFIWIGADGTKALASRFSTMPRYNFYFYIYRPLMFNEDPQHIEKAWQVGGTPFHFACPGMENEDYSLINPVDTYNGERAGKQAMKLINEQIHDFTTPHVIWMEGHDSSGPSTHTTDIIKDIKKQYPDMDVRHSTLEDYAEAIRKDFNELEVSTVYGERRSAQFDHRSGNLYGYITSARMYLKQANFQCEKWLEHIAEPMYTFAGMNGLDISDKYLDRAWTLLLENSAHDSIGGCSLDAIHEDMMYRSKQVLEIARGVTEKATRYLASKLDTSSFHKDALILNLMNLTQFSRKGVQEIVVDVPLDRDLGNLEIRNTSGEKIRLQVISAEICEPVLEQLINRPMYYRVKRYHCLAELATPSWGTASYEICPVEGMIPAGKQDHKFILENEFMKAEVNFDGSLDILDKKNDRLFERMMYFEDEGEAGHAWVHEKREPVISTLETPAKREVIRKNELETVIRATHHMPVPQNLKERELGIACSKLDIVCDITLKSNSDFLEFSVSVNNTAEDHRLRVMMPTQLKIEKSFAEGQFDIVERSTHRPDTRNWVEQPMYDFPVYHFMDVRDEKSGLALLLKGLKEYEILEDKQTVGLTLFRSFRYVINPASEQDYGKQKGSQCLGQQTAEFALHLHAADTEVHKIYDPAYRYCYEPLIWQSGRTRGSIKPGSFLKLSDDQIIMSCIKQADSREKNAYIIRLFNPSTVDRETDIILMHPVRSVCETSLEETGCRQIEHKGTTFRISLGAKKIGTYKIIC